MNVLVSSQPAEATDAGARPKPTSKRLFAVGAAAVFTTTLANVAIASVLGTVLHVPTTFAPLRAPGVVSLTILGVAAAAIVFARIFRAAKDPLMVVTVVAAGGLLLSWIPDIGLYATHGLPGTTASGVLSLMVLHIVAAAGVVLLFGRFVPERDTHLRPSR